MDFYNEGKKQRRIKMDRKKEVKKKTQNIGKQQKDENNYEE